MFSWGEPVVAGTKTYVTEDELVNYHDVVGYEQEYDVPDLSVLSPEDYNLITNEETLAMSVWRKTIDGGFKPFYVEVEITMGMNSAHIKVTEHHGSEVVIPLASVGHETFRPLEFVIAMWTVIFVWAVVIALVAVLWVAAPVIWKMAGLSEADLNLLFGGIPNTVMGLAVIVAVGVIGYAYFQYKTKKGG